jgi:hypothetical protein
MMVWRVRILTLKGAFLLQLNERWLLRTRNTSKSASGTHPVEVESVDALTAVDNGPTL